MPKLNNWTLAITAAIMTQLLGGCVERQLTINTEPSGAMVELNDEQIGPSPVTVSFNWYGDYSVKISKQGYETLNTHRVLEAPTNDHFPWDFFRGVLSSKDYVDSYEWSFKLDPQKTLDREELIKKAQRIRNQMR